MRADRLVATLLLLQTRGKITAPQLAAELEVSEKTARRDLEALAMAGLPVYPQVGRNGGWQLLGGGRTDLSGLTADEARTLFLAAGASASITSDTSSALRKLVRALPETFRAEAEAAARAVVVDPATWSGVAPAEPPAHLDVLQRAVIGRRRVRLGYVNRQRETSERDADPLGLVSKGTVWYLLANTDKGLRTFHVGRVRSVELTDTTFEPPAGFDLATAWRTIADEIGKRRLGCTVRVRIDRRWVMALRGQFGAGAVVAEIDDREHHPTDEHGRIEVIVAGPAPHVIAQHLAGWGGLVEVLDSPEVRHELARIGRELAALYPS